MKTDEDNNQNQAFKAEIGSDLAGKRLDHALVALFKQFSRSQLQVWTKDGYILVNSRIRNPSDKVSIGDQILLKVPSIDRIYVKGQPIALNIIFEDDEIIVINKDAGIVVHPGAGNSDGTIQNGLVFHNKHLSKLPRAGIVHRLDKDTSGLMVVAKTMKSYLYLINALANRKVKRIYRAITIGRTLDAGTINLPIGRHQTNRIKMAINSKGKEAITHYKKLKNFLYHSYLEVELDTGRTHQIRVHFSHLGHPIVGDKTYNKNKIGQKNMANNCKLIISQFNRQALHAESLTFNHPFSMKLMQWRAPLPNDIENLLIALEVNEVCGKEEFDENYKIALENRAKQKND